jgi:guanylate kinase
MDEFDHRVVNDDLTTATDALTDVVARETGIQPVEA